MRREFTSLQSIRRDCLLPALHAEAGWLVVGLAVGVLESVKGPPTSLAFISGAIAGAIVLGIAGIPFSLLGVRGKDIVGGAAVGFTAAVLVGTAISAEAASNLGLAMTAGAFIAATGWPVVRRACHCAVYLLAAVSTRRTAIS